MRVDPPPVCHCVCVYVCAIVLVLLCTIVPIPLVAVSPTSRLLHHWPPLYSISQESVHQQRPSHSCGPAAEIPNSVLKVRYRPTSSVEYVFSRLPCLNLSSRGRSKLPADYARSHNCQPASPVCLCPDRRTAEEWPDARAQGRAMPRRRSRGPHIVRAFLRSPPRCAAQLMFENSLMAVCVSILGLRPPTAPRSASSLRLRFGLVRVPYFAMHMDKSDECMSIQAHARSCPSIRPCRPLAS